MKKNTYKFLIIFLVLILLIFAFLHIFKKDTGYDVIENSDISPLKGITDNIPMPKNITYHGIDYMQSQLPEGKFGGSFITSTIGEPKTFNPYNATDATSAELSGIMYDGLTQTNPTTGEVVPFLAKNFEIMPDNKTYIIHLRHGIKWSDGKPITADDVYFTYKDVIFAGMGDGSARDAMLIDGKLPEIHKIDDYTVKFITPKPFAPFLRNLSNPILPKHVFNKVTKKGREYFLTFQSVDTKPESIVYSGAFKLSEYLPGQRLVFVKNPDYYFINQNLKKLPYIDKWIILIVDDMNNQTLKFEAGMTDTLNVNGSLVGRYRELKKRSDFELYNLGASTNTTFIIFNLNNRKNKDGKYYVNPVKQRWIQDKNFRSAIDWAIDRDDLILNVFSGMAQPLYSAEPIGSLFLNEKIAKGHKKDVNYALKLLEKSGFRIKNKILYDKYGNKVELELLTNAGNTQREAAGVSIKQDLEQIGIKVNFKPIEFNSLIDKTLTSVDFDCIILAFTSNINEPNSGYNVWTPNGALHIFNKRTSNDLKSSDKILPFEKELEKIFNNGALELNFKKRKEIYDRYQEIIADENPLIYLYAPLNISAVRKKVKNIYPTKINGLIHSMSEIYIDE